MIYNDYSAGEIPDILIYGGKDNEVFRLGESRTVLCGASGS